MKKILPLIAIAMLVLIAINTKEEQFVIPNEAIRLRIIANSNSIHDQYIKSLVKVSLEDKLKETVSNKNINYARQTIKQNLNAYKETIENTLIKADYNKEFKINFGQNFFPEKEYKGVKYKEGSYESLVITLGEGNGDNWWCVLFPPLCSLEVEEKETVEYRLFIKDTFNKYMNKLDKK